MLKRRTFHNADCFNFHFNIDISIPKSVSESSTKGRKNERAKEGKECVGIHRSIPYMQLVR